MTPVTDTSESGLESLICTALTGHACEPGSGRDIQQRPPAYSAGWLGGHPEDYEREFCVDLHQLTRFLQATQPEAAESLALTEDGPARRKFLARLQGEITKRGTIDVLRNGLKHGPHDIAVFHGTPSAGNPKAQERFDANRFSVTRQLRYSRDETRLALDLALFINGLPVATFELKNSLTKQTVEDAVEQYKRDRDPREKLFEFGRCMVHFAVDDAEVRFCTHLKGKGSWFLPFNQGWNDGAGNPPNPNGLKTDYLWQQVLTRKGLTDIIENYAQIVAEKDEKTGRKKRTQIWPRYHQLEAVRRLLADVGEKGAGHRYLIQHSAGSGKSNSIAWLAHQLVGMHKGGAAVFDSIVVITDRRILDRQIRDTIRQFAQVGATVGHAERSGDLRRFIAEGKKVIISTVQKFPFILDEIGGEHRGRQFALIIDEAHSSQGGRTSAAVARALASNDDETETVEDEINRLIQSKRMLPNASYFAFTATPKNKTLELFGEPLPADAEGKVAHRPFHSYTMKQAIQEKFIVDVLANYTPVNSYYRLVKTVEGDPEFDVRRAQKKLRRYVEGHDHAIRTKTEIMVDHFHQQVLALNKIGGEARAMVVTGGIDRAIRYFHAFQDYLHERKSPYRAIVAFSGQHEYGGTQVTEASLNEFPSKDIAANIRQDPYRFLICADKFQTGYDEPLLHTMYVDKALSGIKAVQTLSRLNRAHPKKHDTFVLDFMNDPEAIRKAFEPYYRTTLLSDETDPNKLHDLKAELDARQIYATAQIDQFVKLYLGGAGRDRLDVILDGCTAVYREELDEDGQVDFKSKSKAFVRTYGFLSTILSYANAEWEKLSIFLHFLIPKLPAPEEEDLSRGILETIDMDSYRAEKKAAMQIDLPDEDGSLEGIPPGGGGGKGEPELGHLSEIVQAFNDQFGNIGWTDADRVRKMITEEIPQRLAADPAYQNARRNSGQQNARIEHDKALGRVILSLLSDDTELYRQFSDNESFRRWLTQTSFDLTYHSNPESNPARY